MNFSGIIATHGSEMAPPFTIVAYLPCCWAMFLTVKTATTRARVRVSMISGRWLTCRLLSSLGTSRDGLDATIVVSFYDSKLLLRRLCGAADANAFSKSRSVVLRSLSVRRVSATPHTIRSLMRESFNVANSHVRARMRRSVTY